MSERRGDHDDDVKQPAAPLSEWNAADTDVLRRLFVEEAEAHLRKVAEAHAVLSRAATGATKAPVELVDRVMRHLHTLKGAAGSVGYDGIARAAHDLEDLCSEMRSGALAPTPGILERLDEGVAGLRALLDGARLSPARKAPGQPPTPVPGRTAVERRRGDRRTGLDRRRTHDTVLRVDSERLDTLLDGVGDLIILRTRVDRRVRELEGVRKDLDRTRAGLRDVLGALGGAPGRRPTETSAVREPPPGPVLDRLGEVEVEFTEAMAFLERATSALSTESESLRRTAEHLEDELRRARLVPLEWVFARLASTLRELERTTGREADLSATGGDVELDKSVIEPISEALLHLVRNAVAHGIEPADQRVAADKPRRGRVQLHARQEGDFVFLRLEDDGRGIDREAVHRALVRAGRAKADVTPSDAQLIAALFEPGFSSRESSDAVAGRGMGLHIVKSAVSRLGGDVAVEFDPGRFTRFRISVPRTTTITQALLFKVGGQVYAVATAHVLDVLPGLPHERTATPVLRLQTLLGIEPGPARRPVALRLRHGERVFFVTCDKVIGPRTIVVRPLSPLLDALPYYAGVTVSGAGKAQLVLDAGALAEAALVPPRTSQPLRRGQPRVLVVDDSRLVREAAARSLASAGYQPVTAEDGWDAWELLGERRFDAVVTDLEMPRMDGFELIGRIRGEPTLRGLPIVVLSSRTSLATRERALNMGADAVLPKGPNRRALAEAVEPLLRRERD